MVDTSGSIFGNATVGLHDLAPLGILAPIVASPRFNVTFVAGMLVSTCWVQLWWAGLTMGAIVAGILHPAFWRLVFKYIGWPISIIVITLWHMLSQMAIARWVTPRRSIEHTLLWFYLYALFSLVYFTVCCSNISLCILPFKWVQAMRHSTYNTKAQQARMHCNLSASNRTTMLRRLKMRADPSQLPL
jgi:hypothetical protein